MAVVVLALALTGCGVGAVSQDEVTEESQRRGGGVTGALVVEALDAVADEAGRDLTVVQVSAAMAVVDVLVETADGSGLEVYRYGTSGLDGGRGVADPEPRPGPPRAGFAPDEVSAEAFDAAVDRARGSVGPGHWVNTVTVVRPGGLDLVRLSVELTDGVAASTSVEEDLT